MTGQTVDTSAKSISLSTFARACAISFITALVLAVLLNLIVDPFLIYGTGLVEPYRINSYVLKAEQIQAMNPAPRIIVTGSSRVNTVDPELVTRLTGKTCFNWGVPSAGLEVIQAILHLAVEDYRLPVDTAIIGIDPEVLFSEPWVHPQAVLAPMYTPHFGEVSFRSRFRGLLNSVTRLLTIEQVEASIAVIRRELGDESIKEIEIYREDGLALYTPKEEAIEAGEYDLEGIIDSRLSRTPQIISQLVASSGIPENRKNRWIEILDYCDQHDITVYAYLPPGHPRFIEACESIGAMPKLGEVAEFLASTIEEHGGVFADYTSIESFGGEADQFYDEVHMRKANNDRLLLDLFSGYNPDSGGEGR